MFIKNIHVSLCSINLCLENDPGKKCIWKRICQIHQIRWIKYKYKYMVWNLIKYKYKYKYTVFVFVFVFANTNTYLTPALRYTKPGGPYRITTQFYYYMLGSILSNKGWQLIWLNIGQVPKLTKDILWFIALTGRYIRRSVYYEKMT